LELWPRPVAEQFRENDLAVLRQNAVIEVMEQVHEKGGSRSWWLSHKFPYQDASGKRYVGGLGVDITERKKAEEALCQNQLELQNYQAQLQDLTSKLFTAQESERQRIARELHDDVSQRLAALVLDVASLEQQPPLLPVLIASGLTPVRERLEKLSDDVHNLAYTLHPSLLKHAGLEPAIEDHVREVTRRTGLPVLLKVQNVPGSLNLDHSTCLFRVLQESLQNVVKHAHATEAIVKLSGSSKGFGLSIADNGKGFDPYDKSAHRKGLGLISMQERLRLANGFLRVHSKPAGGTKVCAWIPFQRNAS
jgi:signal transduction histidine kinase